MKTQPMKERKIPERRCLGCGNRFPKSDLIRVVRTPEGTVVLDRTGKKNGRGAYLCYSAECFRKARKSGRLRENLACEIPEEMYDKLEAEIAQHE